MKQSTYFQTFVVTIDAKITGSTVINPTEGSRRFYPVFATFEIIAASAIVGVPTLSLGTNSSTYNNIMTATALTGLTSVNKILNTSNLLTVVADSVAPSTEIRVNVTVGAVSTTATLKVMLHGFYD